jgi:hypothetical protein
VCCPQCIYVFCMDLRTNINYFSIQHSLISFYTWDKECLLCVTNWINSDRHSFVLETLTEMYQTIPEHSQDTLFLISKIIPHIYTSHEAHLHCNGISHFCAQWVLLRRYPEWSVWSESTREEWTKGPTTLVVKGLIWFTDGSRMMVGNGAGVYGKSLGRRLRISLENMLQFFRLRYMLSWSVFTKFKQVLGQRNMLVFALTVRQLWEPLRLLTHPHWYDNAKRHWMISLPNTQWHCIGFLDMLGCKETKLPTGLRRTVLLRNVRPELS